MTEPMGNDSMRRIGRRVRQGAVGLCLSALVLGGTLNAQLPETWLPSLPESLSLSLGLRIWLGQPANQVGLDLRGAYRWRMVQLNAGTALQYNFSHLGPRPLQPGPEWQSYLGATVGFGPPEANGSLFLHPVSNQTGRRYAVGYAWKGYLDVMATSQVTALLGLHLGPWALLSENDAYTGRLDDRFRTGTMALAYRRGNLRLALTSILWTGDPRSDGVRKVPDAGVGRFGYRDLSEAKYGRFSHGILALEASYLLPYGQVGQLRMGVDAEQIRHVLQNRLIHDLPFLPDGLVKVRNMHLPPLTPQGNPYLKQPGQRIRAPRAYWQGGLNPALFY